jgi:tetratricopeptide (TPR) repeat protein
MFEKAFRWCRRNPKVASLTGLAAALLLVIAGISTTAYLRAQTALLREQEQRTRIEIEQRRAGNHQLKTEKTLDISLAALDRIFERLTPDTLQFDSATTVEGSSGESLLIRNPPVLSADSAALLQDLLETYDKLAKLQVDDPRLIAESARASRRVGEIHRQLGSLDDAATAFQLAINHYRPIPNSHLEIAKISCSLGDVLRRLKRDSESKQAFGQALNILGQLELEPGLGKDKTQVQIQTARTQYLLAKRSPPIFEKKPPKPKSIFGGIFSPPSRESHKRPSKEQVALVSNASRILSKVIESDPNNSEALFLLALCYREEAKPGDEEAIEPAFEILRQLTVQNPNAPDFQFELAETLIRPGRPSRNGSSNEQVNLEEGKTILANLVNQHPNIPRYQRALSHAYHKSAMKVLKHARQADLDQETAAIAELELALKTQQRLADAFPDSDEFKYWVANISGNLAEALEKNGKVFEAIILNEQAVVLARKFIEDEPSQVPALHLMIQLHHNLARAYRRAGDLYLAEEADRKEKDYHRQLSKTRTQDEPGEP